MDGGTSWQLQEIGAGKDDLRDVCFLDSTTGWLHSVTRPKVFWTFDGGITWEAKLGPTGASGLDSVSFVNVREGWAVAALRETEHKAGRLPPKTLLHTTDGGESWDKAAVWKDEPNLHLVRFLDMECGWLLGQINVYRTEDGGRTWNIVLKVP